MHVVKKLRLFYNKALPYHSTWSVRMLWMPQALPGHMVIHNNRTNPMACLGDALLRGWAWCGVGLGGRPLVASASRERMKLVMVLLEHGSQPTNQHHPVSIAITSSSYIYIYIPSPCLAL